MTNYLLDVSDLQRDAGTVRVRAVVEGTRDIFGRTEYRVRPADGEGQVWVTGAKLEPEPEDGDAQG